MRRLVAIMFLMAGLACAETSWFFAPEGQKDAPVSVNFRKNALDGIFSQAKIGWDGDGLYIFRERGDSLRLIVVAKGGDATLYQKPSQKESRWRNPEAYLREREGLKGYSDFEKCMERFTLDSASYNEIEGLPLADFPVIFPTKADSAKAFHYEVNTLQMPLYLGYKKEGEQVQYFAFRDFRVDSQKLTYPLDAIEQGLKKLDTLLFNRRAARCE